MTPTKIYTFTIPPGGSFPLLAIGDFFKVQNAVGAIEVRGDTFGTIGAVLPGQGLARTRFNRLEFVDKSGAANVVSVLIAGEAFVDDRITGEVSVIDGARARTNALQAFAATVALAGAAAKYSQAQLWNPPGSGKNVIVNAVAATSGGAANIYVIGDSGAAAALSSMAANKRVSGSAGIAQTRATSANSIQPPGILSTFFTLSGNSGSVSQWRPTEPVVLPPGYGLTCSVDVANLSINASFEWFEETIL